MSLGSGDGRRRDATTGRRRLVPDWGSDHLTLDAVVAFVDSELAEGAYRRAAAHVAGCPSCTAEVAEQRQARAALRAANAPTVPTSLLSALRSIPQEAQLPGPPPGLAMTRDGQLVSMLREQPAGLPNGPLRDPLGSENVRGDNNPTVPLHRGAARPRRHWTGRHWASATAVSGIALGALFAGLPSSTPPPAPAAPPERGVLGGSVLGGSAVGGSVDPAAHLGVRQQPAVQPAGLSPVSTPPSTSRPAGPGAGATSSAPAGPGPQSGFPPASLR